MTYLLSGPMRGEHRRVNRERFAHYATALRVQGHTVLSPVEHFGTGRILRNGAQVRKAFTRALVQCDAVMALPGYAASPGSTEELMMAATAGKPIVYA